MGIVIHHYLSPYSFVMGVLWFNAFVLLGLFMRKLKFPIKFSVVPLLLLLVLSVLRMLLAIEMPDAITVLSETFYPAIIDFVRFEILPYHVVGLPISVANMFIFIWVAVAVCLIAKYLYDYIGKFGSIWEWLERCERDEYAESLLAEEIGYDKHFHVYRSGSCGMAMATAIKPCIVLPKADFPPDELRSILLHEWKHIQDKDYLTELIANMICFVFWWNPLVYVFRKNFCFVQELKNDQFAVSKGKSVKHFFRAILSLDRIRKEIDAKRKSYKEVNAKALISDDDELVDRLEVVALGGATKSEPKLRSKRILANVFYSSAIVALFLASYMFTILPAFWESPDIVVTTEDFNWEYRECGDVSRAEENFIIKNNDGTFSLYINGQFVEYIDDTHEFFNWLSIFTREVG